MLVITVQSWKVLNFIANRLESSGVRTHTRQGSVTDHTLCVDLYLEQIRNHQPMGSDNDAYSTPLSIPVQFNRVATKLRGIWYIAYTENVQPFKWSTFCRAYNANMSRVTMAFNGNIIFETQDLLLEKTLNISENFVMT